MAGNDKTNSNNHMQHSKGTHDKFSFILILTFADETCCLDDCGSANHVHVKLSNSDFVLEEATAFSTHLAPVLCISDKDILKASTFFSLVQRHMTVHLICTHGGASTGTVKVALCFAASESNLKECVAHLKSTFLLWNNKN